MLKYDEKVEYTLDGKNTSKKRCSCLNVFQDRRYGDGIRVHNKCRNGWRCTACGTERN